MIISMVLPTKSLLKINKSPFVISYNNLEYILMGDDKNIVATLKVNKKVDATDVNYISECKTIRDSFKEQKDKFPIHSTEKEMINNIRYFENVLYDECDIILQWDKLNVHYYAENEKEEQLKKDGEICSGWGKIIHVKGPRLLDDPEAIKCRLEYCEGLDLELHLFRHANCAIKENNYIEAYFNLFLILESYFSGGSHKYQEKTFRNNELLMKIIGELLKNDKTKNLYGCILQKGEDITSENIISKIVNTRQKIFHFLDIDHPERHITYLNQEDYKNETIALRGIVWRSMAERHQILGKHKGNK